MSDATQPLQDAIIAALRADATVAALIGKRIYDGPPANAQKPYLSFGPVQLLTEHADEYVGGDTALQLDAWSTDKLDIKRVGAAVDKALDGAELTLGDNQRLVALTVERIDYLTEPDGLTKHAAIACRARTEPTA